MVKQRKWILAKHFDGFPKLSDLKLEEAELSPLEDGDVLVEAEYLSVDPYMRPYSKSFPEGSLMPGSQVGKVTQSQNKACPIGSYVVSRSGWQDKGIIKASQLGKFTADGTYKLQDIGDLPKSLALGALGMPGSAAYLGFLKLCRPKEGDTVLVNTAAGAVGSLVGQIAKIKGCKVIGYAGTDEKVQWIKELGFDHAFNYKTCDLEKTLQEAAPDGVDCYFDNVGGEFSQKVIANHMKLFGRVAICGSIDAYNDKTGEPKIGPFSFSSILFKQLAVEGFIVSKWKDDYPDALSAMQKWIEEGKIKYREHVVTGFEKMPEAFISLLSGKNIGKFIVKA